VRVELDERAPRETIAREELFKLRDGREFHCKTNGVVPVRVRYGREREEIRIDLYNDATRLTRVCREPGFPVLYKEVPAAAVTFAFRAERLVAIRPGELRAILLPAD